MALSATQKELIERYHRCELDLQTMEEVYRVVQLDAEAAAYLDELKRRSLGLPTGAVATSAGRSSASGNVTERVSPRSEPPASQLQSAGKPTNASVSDLMGSDQAMAQQYQAMLQQMMTAFQQSVQSGSSPMMVKPVSSPPVQQPPEPQPKPLLSIKLNQVQPKTLDEAFEDSAITPPQPVLVPGNSTPTRGVRFDRQHLVAPITEDFSDSPVGKVSSLADLRPALGDPLAAVFTGSEANATSSVPAPTSAISETTATASEGDQVAGTVLAGHESEQAGLPEAVVYESFEEEVGQQQPERIVALAAPRPASKLDRALFHLTVCLMAAMLAVVVFLARQPSATNFVIGNNDVANDQTFVGESSSARMPRTAPFPVPKSPKLSVEPAIYQPNDRDLAVDAGSQPGNNSARRGISGSGGSMLQVPATPSLQPSDSETLTTVEVPVLPPLQVKESVTADVLPPPVLPTLSIAKQQVEESKTKPEPPLKPLNPVRKKSAAGANAPAEISDP